MKYFTVHTIHVARTNGCISKVRTVNRPEAPNYTELNRVWPQLSPIEPNSTAFQSHFAFNIYTRTVSRYMENAPRMGIVGHGARKERGRPAVDRGLCLDWRAPGACLHRLGQTWARHSLIDKQDPRDQTRDKRDRDKPRALPSAHVSVSHEIHKRTYLHL